MKNKKKVIEILKQDLVTYCKQIGVIDCEIPVLVFTRQDFEARDKDVEDRLDFTVRHTKSKDYLGICSVCSRTIFVRMDWTPAKVVKVVKRTKKYIYSKRVAYGLREVRNTMVHELVHYRFSYLGHGKKFEERIKDILRGKPFPNKHITSPQLSWA